MSEISQTFALEFREAVEIFRKKVGDSRMGSRQYAAWTEDDDYIFKIKDEFLEKYPDVAENYAPMKWSASYYNGAGDGGRLECTEGMSLDVANVEGYKKISLEDTPRKIKNEIFGKYLQQCTEEDEYCFLYGKEKGLKKYQDEVWAKDHIVGDINATRSIVKKFGYFEFNGKKVYDEDDIYCPIRTKEGKELIIRVQPYSSGNGYFFSEYNVMEDNRTELEKKCDNEGFSDWDPYDYDSPMQRMLYARCGQVVGGYHDITEEKRKTYLQDIVLLLDAGFNAPDFFYAALVSENELAEKYPVLVSKIMNYCDVDPLNLKADVLREKLEERLGKTADVRTGEVTDEHRKTAKKQVEISKNIIKARLAKEGNGK